MPDHRGLRVGTRVRLTGNSHCDEIMKGAQGTILDFHPREPYARVRSGRNEDWIMIKYLTMIEQKDKETGLDICQTLEKIDESCLGLAPKYNLHNATGMSDSSYFSELETETLPIDFRRDIDFMMSSLHGGAEGYVIHKDGDKYAGIILNEESVPRRRERNIDSIMETLLRDRISSEDTEGTETGVINIISFSVMPGSEDAEAMNLRLLEYALVAAHFKGMPVRFEAWSRHPSLAYAKEMGFSQDIISAYTHRRGTEDKISLVKKASKSEIMEYVSDLTSRLEDGEMAAGRRR